MAEENAGDEARRTSETEVLDALRIAPDHGVGQSELIRETGLARGTVVNIVRRLEGKHLVDTFDRAPGPDGGRPAKVVRLRDDAAFALGVQFGHSHVRVSVGNLRGYEIFFSEDDLTSRSESVEAVLPVGDEAQESLDLAVHLVQKAMAWNAKEGRSEKQLIGVGVGWPAPVEDSRSGDVVIDGSMRSWLGVRRPAERLKEMLGLDPRIEFWTENDANLGALMELEHGVGHHHRNFVYIHWSSGIGGAMVGEGSLQRGASNLAGEIGHIPLFGVGPATRPCHRCGSDHCLEVLAGGAAIVEKVLGAHAGNLGDVIRAAQTASSSKHRLARQELDRAAGLVGRALGSVITFNNPGAIVIGGQFGRRNLADDGSDDGLEAGSLNPFNLIAAGLRRGLQEASSTKALASVSEINSSRWSFAAVQGAATFATREGFGVNYLDRLELPSIAVARKRKRA
jgi:predicted NBD/HSP70 family sugar kinase